MESQLHHIQKQYLEVEFNGTASEGIVLLNSLSDLYYHRILPALEEVFKRYASLQGHLAIERLDIDAGTFHIESLESTFFERIVQSLEKSLQELSVPTPPFVSAPQLHSTDTGMFTCKTEGECICDAFIFFLKNGTLPWPFHPSSSLSFEDVLYKFFKEPERSDTLKLIRGSLVAVLNSATARKRLVHQFTPRFLDNLLALISPEGASELRGFLPLFRSSEIGHVNAKKLEKLLWERVFTSVAGASPLRVETIITEIQAYTTEGESIFDAFILFLNNGTLPRPFHLSSGSTFEEAVYKFLKEPEKSGCVPDLVKRDVVEALTSSTARKRLVHQFTTLFLETLLSVISPEGAAVLRGFLPLFRCSEALSVDAKQLEALIWEDAFASLASGATLTEQTIITAIRRALRGSVFRDLSSESRFEPYRSDVSANQTVSGIPLQPSLFDNGKTEGTMDEQSTCPSGIHDKNTSNSLSTMPHPDAKTGIYTGLAGLVLLHPFLPQLLRALSIADDDKLLQPDRAIYLLYFLATGTITAPEYELVLPKILSNTSLRAVVDSDIILTVEELDEAEALLSAVILHWEVLKNTGTEGLRETFLKRSGKLSLLDNGEWFLQIESNACDILLEQLPWGISMIKLPWMPEMLRVEWV